MAMRGPLRAEVSRYNKRNKHSIDGLVAGMPPYHGTNLSNGMAADAHVEQVPPHFDLYDPFNPMYEWAQPDYRPPDPWFEGMSFRTPLPERIAGTEHRVVQTPILDAVQQLLEIDHAVISARDDIGNEFMLQQISWGHTETVEKHPWFSDRQVPQEMVDAAFGAAVPVQAEPPMPEPAVEPDTLSEMAGPDPQQPQQGLEALVQEAMLQQNPNELQPDFFAEQQLMQEEEIRQLLDPFAMPGFGPG